MPEAFKTGYIALIGYPNVGKSTLLNRLVGGKLAITSPKPQTTRFRLLGIVNLPEAQMLFLDTPGVLEAKGSILNETLVQAALSALTPNLRPAEGLKEKFPVPQLFNHYLE